jgi:ADP-ribose pyrophosphatase YjhB (NUDIX family)
MTEYRNTPTVVVGLIPVMNPKWLATMSFSERREYPPGLVMIRRKDNGKLALPGGYQELGESLEGALFREIYEETGIVFRHRMADLRGLKTAPDMSVNLAFYMIHDIIEIPDTVENNEVFGVLSVFGPPDGVAFPMHDEAIRNFFGQWD